MDKIDNKSIREIVLNKYGCKCAYCGTDLTIDTLTVDHIEPKYRGYSNKDLARYSKKKGECNIENYNPACASCNSSKSTFSIEKWRHEILMKHNRLLRDVSQYRLLHRLGMITYNSDFKIYFERSCHVK